MADVVDLTLDSDDEQPQPLAARLAQRAPSLKRPPLSPVAHNAASPPAAAAPHGLGGRAEEDAARRKSLAAILDVKASAGAGHDVAARLAAELDRPLVLPDAGGPAMAAAAAARPGRRQRRAGGALAALQGAFDDDWDGSVAPREPPRQQQPQQDRASPRGGARPGGEGGTGGAGASPPVRRGGVLRGRLVTTRAGGGGGSVPGSQLSPQPSGSLGAREPWRQAQQAQQHHQLPWEAGASQDTWPAGTGDADWVPGGSQPDEGMEGEAPKRKRRTKRTQEEKEAEAAEKARLKEQKRLDKAQAQAEKERAKEARQRERKFASEANALQWVTVLLDSKLMNTALGRKIADRLEETQGKGPDECIHTDVRDLGLAPYKAIKWLRKELRQPGALAAAQGGLDALDPLGYLDPSESGPMVEVEMPYVMVCMQAEEFVSEVERDRLEGLFALLEARCAGYRASLAVCGLAGHLTQRERREGHQNIQARAQNAPVGFVRWPIDDFVAALAVECPSLGFRDVVDAPQPTPWQLTAQAHLALLMQAGEHVYNMTRAIAREPYRANDATQWLGAHSKKETAAMKTLLANNPIADKGVETLAQVLYAMPVSSVQPAVAHAVASRFRGMGALMDFLLDPSRPAAAKQKELAELQRSGQARKVGPAAAKRLLELLTATNPDLPINPADV